MFYKKILVQNVIYQIDIKIEEVNLIYSYFKRIEVLMLLMRKVTLRERKLKKLSRLAHPNQKILC
jgi:hypothetical protein